MRFEHSKDKVPKYAAGHNHPRLGQSMFIKTQITTMPDGRSRYRFKQWQESAPEPAA